MANIRTHPHEWGRLLELLNLSEMTSEQKIEYELVRSVFASEEPNGIAVKVLDGRKIVLRADSIKELSEKIGLGRQSTHNLIRDSRPINKGKYKGCRIKLEGEPEKLPEFKDCKECGRVKGISEFKVFLNGRVSKACATCRERNKNAR